MTSIRIPGDNIPVDAQTRTYEGDIKHFPSVDAAFVHAETDRDVYKVSFDAASGERIRLVRAEGQTEPTVWVYDPMHRHIEAAIAAATGPVFIQVQEFDEVKNHPLYKEPSKYIDRTIGVPHGSG